MSTEKECLQYEYPLETADFKFFHILLSPLSGDAFIRLAIFYRP
jgi:hypothetical protein